MSLLSLLHSINLLRVGILGGFCSPYSLPGTENFVCHRSLKKVFLFLAVRRMANGFKECIPLTTKTLEVVNIIYNFLSYFITF